MLLHVEKIMLVLTFAPSFTFSDPLYSEVLLHEKNTFPVNMS